MKKVFSICCLQLLIVATLLAQEADLARIFSNEEVNSYEEATNAFLEWIGSAADPSVGDPESLVRHLRWIALITPKSSPIHEAAYRLISSQGTPADAQMIVSWWHRQDPLPATLHNERIEEHLYRVYFAQANYAYRKDSLGVDDRGRIFVRFGKPWRESVINLLDSQLRTLPLEYRLPRNEIWVYRGIHDDAHYLFVQLSRRKPYQIDTPESLIPPNLQGTQRRMGILLAWMEDVFGQLAMAHDHYGTVYDQVVNYNALPTSAPMRPHEFSQKALQMTKERDDQHQLRRAQTVPPLATQVYGNAVELKPDIRFSRFLDGNGATRLEVYWSIELDKVRPSRTMIRRSQQLQRGVSSDFILTASLTTRGTKYEPQNIQIRRYHLPDGYASPPRVYSWITSEYDPIPPIALQWSLHWTVPDSIPPQPAAPWGIGIATLDTLRALKGDGSTLELSDLKLLQHDSLSPNGNSIPYVKREIQADTPLSLYFEAYFLRFNENDQTSYTVEYSLHREGQESTSTSFEYEGDDATIQELISIDIEQWNRSGPFTLELTVTDLVANTSVSRSIDLNYKK